MRLLSIKKKRNIFQNRGNIDDQGEMIALIERFGCFVWENVTSCCKKQYRTLSLSIFTQSCLRICKICSNDQLVVHGSIDSRLFISNVKVRKLGA